MPHNSNFRLPRGHRFRPKFDFMVMAPNHGWDTLGSILGPIGTKKWVKTVKKIPCPNIRINFDRNSIFTVLALNNGGDPLGSILGTMGSHWVHKMGQNRKKLPCPKIRIFDYPTVIDFDQNFISRLWGQFAVGTP